LHKQVLGMPNIVKMFFLRNFITTLASFIEMAMASTHLEM